jgi:hypothetical protein
LSTGYSKNDSTEIEQFGELLRKYGFTVSAPETLLGTSGVRHTFDIGATREDAKLFLDLTSAQVEVGVDRIAEFYAKMLDAKPQKGILITIPRLSEDAKKLTGMYDVNVISAESLDEAVQKLALALMIVLRH